MCLSEIKNTLLYEAIEVENAEVGLVLVPRLIRREEREPGICCLRMLLIATKFHGSQIPPCNVCVTITTI